MAYFRDAWRALRAAPLISSLAVLSLALGMGANATFFSILNTLVIKPLPVSEPHSLVVIRDGSWTYPIWEQIRERQASIFEGALAWSTEPFDLAATGATELVDGAYVSGDFFRVLGVIAERGRVLSGADDVRGGGPDGPVAVISHRFWRQRFGGAENVIGQRINVQRRAFTIVGVTPASFFGLDVGRAVDVMVPFGTEPLIRGAGSYLDGRATWWLEIGGRLKPGQTLEQAQAALRAIQPEVRAATIPPQFPAPMAARYLSQPLELAPAATGLSSIRARYQPALVAIMVVAALVLLIACANVANLLLARATARGREFSVRLALGASRSRLAAQLLIESLMLSALGALGGVLLASWGSALVVRQLSTWRGTVFLDLSPDWRVFAFVAAVTVLTAILFGLAPAWSIRAAAPQEALRQGGRGMTGDRRFATRNVLVVAQIALSLVSLVGAGLFLRTFVSLSRVPLGLTRAPLMAVDLNLQRTSVRREEQGALVERLRQAAAGVPGVQAAAASVVTPLSGRGWNAAVGEPVPNSRPPMTWMNGVSPGWFSTAGARILAGRDFTTADGPGGPKVAIVNESFASRYLMAGPAVGQTFRTFGPSQPDVYEVVGLASDVLYRSPREGMVPTVFVPLATASQTPSLLVRFAPGLPSQTATHLSDVLRQVDPNAGFTFRPLDDLVRATMNQERLVAGLSVAFGGLALVLAAVGLYGVMSYSVSRRRAEIAVRMALGASRGTISRLVVGRGSAMVVAGLAVGALASWWASRYVQTLLFQLDPRDLATMAGAAVLLGLVGLLAAWVPAWRASRVDPAGLLRES